MNKSLFYFEDQTGRDVGGLEMPAQTPFVIGRTQVM